MSRDPSTIASDPDVSAWVAANAGAGKTYTLANRVARLLLADTRPERILCLTFTKAAAAEMQHRLFRQLGEWAMLPDDDLRARIVAIGGEAHVALPKARRLFAAALETPGGLKILTIHAFCQIVLSRFPLEAKIPPAFDVLDDQTAREMIGEARQRILERAGSGDAVLAAAVSHIVTETGEARLTGILNAALGGDRRKLDRFFAGDPDIAVEARRPYGLAQDESMQSIAAEFCRTVSIATLQEMQGWLNSGTATDQQAAMVLAGLIATGLAADSFDGFAELFFTQKGERRKKLATKKLAEARPDLMAALNEMADRYESAAERHRAARAAGLAQAALTLIAAMRADYARAKRARGVLDYDDLILSTRNLLLSGNAAQWVLYKLDGGIDHVLIDEAQDTSPEQWDIVKALTGEFFAGAGRERKAVRTLFAVGDEKQSIFSFQGADPAQFAINRRIFAELAQGAQHPFEDVPLLTSRRSAPEILSFVDTVFAAETARAGLTSDGAAITHQVFRDTAKGGVEFWPALRPQDDAESDPYAPLGAVQEQDPVARLAIQVADKIAGWLKSGARLPGKEKAVTAGDIMILLPRREPFGGEVIRQLKLRDVAVAGADRVRLTEQIAAMDLIALGRFAVQREDDLNLAALLRSPLCGLSDDDLFALAHTRKSDLWQALAAQRGDSAVFTAAHDFLSRMLERADYAPPFEFYSHALTAPLFPGKMGGREKLLARLGPESADAIDEFLSLTLAHERGHTPSLERFLDWVARGGTEIKRDMERGRNEVRVMTVHGAKGLEADIVILPDTTAQPGGLNRNDGLLHTPDGIFFPLSGGDAPQPVQDAKAAAAEAVLNEHRRLLYVALTRARERLYVCGFEGKREAKDTSWYALTRAAAESLGVEVTQGDGTIRSIGTLTEEQGEADSRAKTVLAVPGWASAPPQPEPVTPNPIQPSDIAGPSGAPPSPLAAKARFARGNVVHALLARLPDVAPTDRARIALAFARASRIADAEALVAETLAVLDDPQFAEAFGPASKAEVALHATRPDLGLRAPIVGRLDRLAVLEDRVLIVDFKTNRPAPTRADQVAGLYLDQMALYRAGAQAIFPGKRVVCALVFTDGPRLLQLEDVVLDARIADISGRLNPV